MIPWIPIIFAIVCSHQAVPAPLWTKTTGSALGQSNHEAHGCPEGSPCPEHLTGLHLANSVLTALDLISRNLGSPSWPSQLIVLERHSPNPYNFHFCAWPMPILKARPTGTSGFFSLTQEGNVLVKALTLQTVATHMRTLCLPQPSQLSQERSWKAPYQSERIGTQLQLAKGWGIPVQKAKGQSKSPWVLLSTMAQWSAMLNRNQHLSPAWIANSQRKT